MTTKNRKTIRVVAPLAVPGDRVLVANYRSPQADDEPGVVESVEYDYEAKTWSYRVLLDRRSDGKRYGGRMWRYVSDAFCPPLPVEAH